MRKTLKKHTKNAIYPPSIEQPLAQSRAAGPVAPRHSVTDTMLPNFSFIYHCRTILGQNRYYTRAGKTETKQNISLSN